MSFRNPPAGAPGGRDDLLQRSWGILVESCRREALNGGRTSASGRIWYNPVGLIAGDLVTGVVAYHTAGGTAGGAPLYKYGLYEVTPTLQGTLIAQTANESAQINQINWRQFPFTAAKTITRSGVYYIAVLGVWTTGPTWPFAGSSPVPPFGDEMVPSKGKQYYTNAGPFADLPATVDLPSLGATPGTLGVNYQALYTTTPIP